MTSLRMGKRTLPSNRHAPPCPHGHPHITIPQPSSMVSTPAFFHQDIGPSPCSDIEHCMPQSISTPEQSDCDEAGHGTTGNAGISGTHRYCVRRPAVFSCLLYTFMCSGRARLVVVKLVRLDANSNHVSCVDVHPICQGRV